MQLGPSRTTWRRYVALGDSFTEGLADADPQRTGEYRGWADRLAEHLAAAAHGELEYANLAIRGRLLAQVLGEQLPVALDAGPDLVSLVAGGNDLMRPGSDPDELAAGLEAAVVSIREAGADVLLATSVDTRNTPILRRVRGKIAVFNSNIWSVANRTTVWATWACSPRRPTTAHTPRKAPRAAPAPSKRAPVTATPSAPRWRLAHACKLRGCARSSKRPCAP